MERLLGSFKRNQAVRRSTRRPRNAFIFFVHMMLVLAIICVVVYLRCRLRPLALYSDFQSSFSFAGLLACVFACLLAAALETTTQVGSSSVSAILSAACASAIELATQVGSPQVVAICYHLPPSEVASSLASSRGFQSGPPVGASSSGFQ